MCSHPCSASYHFICRLFMCYPTYHPTKVYIYVNVEFITILSTRFNEHISKKLLYFNNQVVWCRLWPQGHQHIYLIFFRIDTCATRHTIWGIFY